MTDTHPLRFNLAMPFASHGSLFIIATRLTVSSLRKRRRKGFLSRRPIPGSSHTTSRSFPPERNALRRYARFDRDLQLRSAQLIHTCFPVKSKEIQHQ